MVDTSAGPNLMNEEHLKLHWKCCIRRLESLQSKDATNDAISLLGVTLLNVHMRVLQVWICFEIVQNRAMHFILWTTYIDKGIQGILLMEGKIVHEHFALVAILERDKEASMSKIFCGEAPLHEQDEHATIWLAKFISISAKTESSVGVKMWSYDNWTDTDGHVIRREVPGRGIHEVCSNVSRQILVTNVSRKPALFNKNNCIALGTGPPKIYHRT